MTTTPLPFSELYTLGRLGQAGDTVSLEADSEQRAAIARWSEVEAVERFLVTTQLTKTGPASFRIAFALDADVVQACVVTLAPVRAHIARAFTRELTFVGRQRGADPILPPMEEDTPEAIESLHYDLAAPALEEYSLALDPYPRAPGAAFAPPAGAEDAPDNPFAALKALKKRP